MFDKVQNLTFFNLVFAIFDLETNFLVHFTLRFSLSSIEKDQNLTYNRDLWPQMTSGDLVTTFLESSRQERRFDLKFTLFHSSWKFDLLLRFFTVGDLASSFWKVDVNSVILIWNLPASINFEIWP